MQNKVEELRKISGLSQTALGQIVGVSRQTIGYIENDRFNPSLSLAFKISRYFERPIEDIFTYED